MNISTSEARIQANRRNSQKSTGPKTEEGRASSRRNALKHGLTATVVDLNIVDDSQPRSDGAGMSRETSPSRPAPHVWLSEQVVRVTGQIDRAQRIEARLRDQAAWRAITAWDDDRKLDAEELGSKLARNPSTILARLRRTIHGCDWLITRWTWLARAVETNSEGWTEAQTALAFHLLGTPEEGRTGPIGNPADLTRSMLNELEERRNLVDEADEIAQALAEADLVDVPTPELARLRRYEQALHRRLKWLLDELRTEAPSQPHLDPSRLVEPSTLPQDAPRNPEAQPERNEAKPSTTITGETKPNSLEPTSAPPRNRPNLARQAKRDRRKRRDRKRNRQLA